MKRFALLTSVLFSFGAACGGGDKPVEEPMPAPMTEDPAPDETTASEETPPTEPTPPAEPPPPPTPDPKSVNEDLDGDGTPEAVTLKHTGEMGVGESQNVALAPDKLGDFAAVELRVIDLDKKDKAKELAVVSGTTWWVITYDGKNKALGEPAEVSVAGGEPTMKGDKKLVSMVEDCGQKVTTTWSLSKGKLSKKEKKSGKRDEAKCAGATPAPEK
jgi:hypothetical protein